MDGGNWAAGIGTQGGGDVGAALATQEGDGEVTADGERLWRSARADLAAIFIERDVTNMMEFVLNAPVPAHQGE